MSQKSAKIKMRASGFTVIISLSLVLFMLGALGLLIINATKLSKEFKENVGFQVYLRDTASSVQTDALIQELSNARFTRRVNLITKEQAAEQLKKELGEDFLSYSGGNPLLNSLDVKLEESHVNSDTLRIVEKMLMQKPFVKEVVYQEDLIDNLNRNTKAVAFFILIFSSALLIVAVALINNTIRLSIYSQRFLIRTMYLVGATRAFISRPFVFKGLRQGIIAGMLAGLMLAVFLIVGVKFIPELALLQNENMLLLLFGGIVLIGIIISALSAFFSVMRYLKLKTGDLYF